MPRRIGARQRVSEHGLARISEHRVLTEPSFEDDDMDPELAKKRQQFFFQALRRTIRNFQAPAHHHPPAGKKRIYRKTKRLRPCAKHTMFWIPLFVILIEQYLGYILRVKHVRKAYYDQVGYEPWSMDQPTRVAIDIYNLTTIGLTENDGYNKRCRGDLRWISNKKHSWYQYYANPSSKIPAMIHQTNTKDRCFTMNFAKASQKWSGLANWEYYVHDEYALAQLFLEIPYPEFPQLHLVVENCVVHPQVQTNLWSYLVLWVYGGIVANVNSMPDQFHLQQKEDDAILIYDVTNQRMNTTFLAASPRHPVLYYAMQHALWRILTAEDIASPDLLIQTGSEALQMAVKQCSGKTIDFAAIQLPFTVTGAEQPSRSVKIVSSDEKYATPIFISSKGITKEFGKMGIEMGALQGEGGSCFSQMHANLDKLSGGHNKAP